LIARSWRLHVAKPSCLAESSLSAKVWTWREPKRRELGGAHLGRHGLIDGLRRPAAFGHGSVITSWLLDLTPAML
jgi:hypothetical protein